nr:hypothetical protein TetV2_00217 [Oceanusvirus sp.]
MLSNSQKYLLRMNDGRHFTDWTPRGSQPLPTDTMPAHAAKDHLIATADQRMMSDRSTAAQSVGMSLDAVAAVEPIPGFELTQACDSRACGFSPAPMNGQPVLGLQPSARSPDALPGARGGVPPSGF